LKFDQLNDSNFFILRSTELTREDHKRTKNKRRAETTSSMMMVTMVKKMMKILMIF